MNNQKLNATRILHDFLSHKKNAFIIALAKTDNKEYIAYYNKSISDINCVLGIDFEVQYLTVTNPNNREQVLNIFRSDDDSVFNDNNDLIDLLVQKRNSQINLINFLSTFSTDYNYVIILNEIIGSMNHVIQMATSEFKY